jgi:hypothetical protein
MKAGIIIWSLGTLLATGGLYGYDMANRMPEKMAFEQEVDQYCAKMRDGKMIVIHEGKEIGADVFLTNGTTVKPDGTVISKEGVRINLSEGQCIDANGKLQGDKLKDPN